MQGQADAVVGYAVLGVVVGADLFAAVAASDQAAAGAAEFLLGGGVLGFFDALDELGHGDLLVFVLAAAVLAFRYNARG